MMRDDVVRTIIDLPDDQLDALAAVCEREGFSRAEAVRRAVREFTRTCGTSDGSSAFGLAGAAGRWAGLPAAAAGAVVMRAAFDTNIPVDYLNGVAGAKTELTRFDERVISVVTWMR